MKLKFLSLYMALSLFSGQCSLAVQHDMAYRGSVQLRTEICNTEVEEDILSNYEGLLLYDSYQNSNLDAKRAEVELISSEQTLNLENALRSNNLKIIKNALSHVASFGKNWNTVKSIIEQGANIDDPTSCGLSPLMIAAANGEIDVVRWLIENGADVDHQSNYGWTAMMSASILGHLDVVKLLIGNGTDVNIAAESGLTPLMVASFGGSYRVVDYLVDNGADVGVVAEDMSTAPQLASSGQHWDIVEFLTSSFGHERKIISPSGISLPSEGYWF